MEFVSPEWVVLFSIGRIKQAFEAAKKEDSAASFA
jgi:hypothetical protein